MSRSLKIAVLCFFLFSLSPLYGTAQENALKIWLSEALPLDLLLAVNPLFEEKAYIWTNNLDEADLALDFERGEGAVMVRWVYVPIVPFASVAESITWADIRRFWRGEGEALSYLTPDNSIPSFVASPETYRAMVSLLGDPAEGIPMRFVPTTAEIPAELWASRPYSWGVTGFNTLTPDVKVLTLDRADVFSDAFDLKRYPLTATLQLKGETAKLGVALEDLSALGSWRPSNRDPQALARVVLTGVTALTRATAFKMEEKGMTYPAQAIQYFFEDAHLLHTSNEVSFTENCAEPDPFGGVIFCSQEEYLELLLYIGLDVVELTGNHINDYGAGAFRNTLDIYATNNIATFGGGYDLNDARDAYITEVQGNRLAFIGCNVPGPNGAFATQTQAGAAPCDDAYLAEELPRLARENDLVIMGVQEFEYYRYTAGIEQIRRFQTYADWGADVVIGSQAHQPQGFTLTKNGAFLHHGLGNLFFDQMQALGTRQMLADKLIVYEGRLINVVLFTGLIEDFCCPRPMTAPERADFLRTLFQASGW
jgi:poly-gamma-glutamate synthesis protein (capsule biosynthesis protein)